MPYATDTDLLARAPSAAAINSTLRATALADAKEMIDERAYVGRTLRAHVALAMHYLTLMPGSGLATDGGAVSSRSAGEISVSYAVTSPDSYEDSLLATTSWGRQFLEIRSTVMHSPEVG